MKTRTLKDQIGDARVRLDSILRSSEHAGSEEELLRQSIEVLQASLEELHVADEDLREKSDQLTLAFQQLDAERDRYRELFESAPHAYVVTDRTGVIVEVNRAAELLFEVPRHFLTGKTLTLFVKGEHRRSFRDRMSKGESGAWQSHFESRSGRNYPVSIALVSVSDPRGAVQLRWTIRDISEQLRTETQVLALNLELEGRITARTEELLDAIRVKEAALVEERRARALAEASRTRIEFLADASSLLAESFDLEHNLARVAERAVPAVGDVCLVDLREADGSIREIATAVAASAPAGLAEQVRRLLAGDDLERPGEAGLSIADKMCVPIRIRDQVMGAITLLILDSARTLDEADRRVLEILAHRATMAIQNSQLHREQETGLRARDEFLAMLGHELRNPVSAIRHAAAVVRAQAPESSGAPAQILIRQSKHLTRLIDDLLDLTRLAHGKMSLQMRTVQLDALALRCVEGLVESGRADARRIRVEAEPVYVEGDPARLQQVVENLLDNALKYSPAGTRIELEVRGRDGQATIAVTDHGKGIPKDMAERIFDPYVQIQGGETTPAAGLGLPATVAPTVTDAFGPPAMMATRALRILVVEDDPDSREALRLLLELWGHEVDDADDGPVALDKAESLQPEVVFVDIGLPGMDGYDLARELRTRADPPPLIVALTGFGRPGDRGRALEAGFDEHLLKPPSTEDLMSVLGRITADSRAF